MKARITFRAEVYFEGKDLKEIRNKFESTDILTGGAEFVEITSVEDADTLEDVMHKFNAPDEVEERYVCPKCGHIFIQGEMNYNYDFGTLDFECPECEWSGNENSVKMTEN